jgi:hypothetical protein
VTARALLLSALLIAGCSAPPSVSQTLGQCRMNAARDARTSEADYVIACMSAQRYQFDQGCAPYSSQTIAACFKPV